ncbi:MAG TPA: glycosyltransferase family 2 protein [Gemmatimonadaceae bacterium]|nr:glycosyltransferase family 2 protein [Gemmatimonadaceae bacterium]
MIPEKTHAAEGTGADDALPEVSVIIPTYNRLWCLPRAVGSCRGTRCRTEIIVVDDGSTDGTWEWLQAQPDVRALRQPNAGQTYAINRGTAAARAPYVRFLDSDDALVADMIDRQLAAARAAGATLVYSRVDRIDLESGVVMRNPDLAVWDDFVAAQLGEGDGGHFLGMLFHRSLVESVPRRPDFALREDRMFLLEVALLGPRTEHVPGCAGYWSRHADQMHDTYRGTKEVVANWQHVTIYRRILGELERRGELTPRRRRAAAGVLVRLAHDIARTDRVEARQLWDWAVSLDPGAADRVGSLAPLYRALGFANTERLLAARRSLLRPLAALRTPSGGRTAGRRPPAVVPLPPGPLATGNEARGENEAAYGDPPARRA